MRVSSWQALHSSPAGGGKVDIPTHPHNKARPVRAFLLVALLYIYTAMPPPFSYRELKLIQDGHRRNQDLMDLLREVKRLRDLVASAFAAMNGVPMNQFKVETNELIDLFAALRAEPAVQEYIRMDQKRKELEFRRRQARERQHVRTKPADQKRG